MNICPACASKTPDEASFCPTCETRLDDYAGFRHAPDVLFNRAVEALEEGRPLAALETLSIACHLRPSDQQVIEMMIDICVEQGQYEEAMERCGLLYDTSADEDWINDRMNAIARLIDGEEKKPPKKDEGRPENKKEGESPREPYYDGPSLPDGWPGTAAGTWMMFIAAAVIVLLLANIGYSAWISSRIQEQNEHIAVLAGDVADLNQLAGDLGQDLKSVQSSQGDATARQESMLAAVDALKADLASNEDLLQNIQYAVYSESSEE